MRAGSLSDPRVVAMVTKYFVPATVPLLSTKHLIRNPWDLVLLEDLEAEQESVPNYLRKSFYGGEREAFFTPEAELLDVFLSLHSGAPDQQQYSSAVRAKPEAAVEEFFARAARAMRRTHGELPADWREFRAGTAPEVAATAQSPIPPPRASMEGLTLRVWVRNSMLMYDRLVGSEVLQLTKDEASSLLPAKIEEGASIDWSRALVARLAHAMYPRGQVLLRLEDSSIQGSLRTRVQRVGENIVSGVIAGEVRLVPAKPEELGPREPARKFFDVHAVLRGEFAWDRRRGEFASLQLASTKSRIDYKAHGKNMYPQDTYEVGVELLKEPAR